jgi:hypothetical protein
MSPLDPDEGFKVTDRRRRPDQEVSQIGAGARAVEPPSPPDPTEHAAPRDLTGLFAMLASSALIGLGESPDPLTGHVQRDLAQARDAIEMLRLLRDRTQGNRTPDEDRLLDQILYDLQLAFVRTTKQRSG